MTELQREVLVKYVTEARQHLWVERSGPWLPEKVLTSRYAVDACMDDSLKQYACVKVPISRLREGCRWWKALHTDVYIGVAELRAALEAVKHAVSQSRGPT